MPRQTLVLTGATGFIGRHLAAALCRAGYSVRAMVRRDDPELRASGVELWHGTFASDLAPLVAEARVVIHAGGAVRARDPGEFHRVNAEGSARLAAAAARAGCERLLYVSSLAARQPELSAYAASKAAGETAIAAEAGRMAVTVVRPPAVYGPGDRGTLPLLRGLARGYLVHPSTDGARFSLLYVEDTTRLLLALLAAPPDNHAVLEPDDGTAGGYGWSDLARTAATSLGRPIRRLALPRGAMTLAAALAESYGRAAARPSVLSRGKVAELYHRDWVSDTRATSALGIWRPQVRFAEGLTATLTWYRAAGWL